MPRPSGVADLLDDYGGLSALLDPTNRIVGGAPANITDFPWIVSMQRFGAHRCAACIITDRHALTAAHCTGGGGIVDNALRLRAGTSDNRIGGQLASLVSVVNHPHYNPFTLDNDIAVLRIDVAWNIGKHGIAAVAMPLQGLAVRPGTKATVAGWGATCEWCLGTSRLRAVGVPIVSNEECDRSYGGGITDGMLCAGFPEGGRDACQGDSGGPLTANGLLVGVVSWGLGCARPDTPGVYARVDYYRDWIDSVLESSY